MYICSDSFNEAQFGILEVLCGALNFVVFLATQEMSYAAFKMVHCPTGVDNCAAAYLTHSAGEAGSDAIPLLTSGPELIASGGYWASTPREATGGSGVPPNLVITKANVIEVFYVRLLEGDESSANVSNGAGNPETTPRGGVMAGLSYVKLELACHYRYLNPLLQFTRSLLKLVHSRDILFFNGTLHRELVGPLNFPFLVLHTTLIILLRCMLGVVFDFE